MVRRTHNDSLLDSVRLVLLGSFVHEAENFFWTKTFAFSSPFLWQDHFNFSRFIKACVRVRMMTMMLGNFLWADVIPRSGMMN